MGRDGAGEGERCEVREGGIVALGGVKSGWERERERRRAALLRSPARFTQLRLFLLLSRLFSAFLSLGSTNTCHGLDTTNEIHTNHRQQPPSRIGKEKEKPARSTLTQRTRRRSSSPPLVSCTRGRSTTRWTAQVHVGKQVSFVSRRKKAGKDDDDNAPS